MGQYLLSPELGLFFWTLVIFVGFFFLLKKLAWKPILNALKEREESIENSLQQAEVAREEMTKLTATNEALLHDARGERDKILQDAQTLHDQIVKEAKEAAATEGAKEMEKIRKQIEAEKRSALNEIKDTAAIIAIEVAEKILRKEFEDAGTQQAYAKSLIKDLSDN